MADDITVPVVCLRGSKKESDLTLCGEGVQLTIVFTLQEYTKDGEAEQQLTQVGRYLPSSSAYRTVRSCVMAMANAKSVCDAGRSSLVSTVRYAIEGTRYVITTSYDLTRDFLLNLDMLFTEGCQLLDQGMGASHQALLDGLHRLTAELHLRLLSADHIVTEKIVAILRRLHPYIHSLARVAHPYVSLALFLTKPLRQVLYPYVEPSINRALSVHDRLQKNFLLGPIVTSATEKAVTVYKNTAFMYEALEQESKLKWD